MTGTTPIQITILGCTGSIGTQALDVIRRHPNRFEVVGLAAGGSNLTLLSAQVKEFRPQIVAVAKPLASADLNDGQGRLLRDAADTSSARLWSGPESTAALAGEFPAATVLNGIDGGVGLAATLRALESGSTLALANKESLIVGGSLVRRAMVRPGQIVPVDSEHSAIAQALRAGVHEKGLVSPVITGRTELQSLVLTASGGPFRGRTRTQLEGVTAKQALAHPTWSMGPVVTVNSSTLMNKGLELIEAALLFDVPPAQIIPVIHPQSIVHSMVTWRDGSTIAQASYPDMRVPIALGMDWPDHLADVGTPLRWDEATSWAFEPVDHQTFPALNLARQALESSPTHPSVLNAANEVGVAAFLRGQVPWTAIVDTVAEVLAAHEGAADPTYEDVLAAQQWAVARAAELLGVSAL